MAVQTLLTEEKVYKQCSCSTATLLQFNISMLTLDCVAKLEKLALRTYEEVCMISQSSHPPFPARPEVVTKSHSVIALCLLQDCSIFVIYCRMGRFTYYPMHPHMKPHGLQGSLPYRAACFVNVTTLIESASEDKKYGDKRLL